MELAFVIWAVGTLPGIASGMCFALFWVVLLSLVGWVITKLIGIDCKESDKASILAASKLGRGIFLVSFPLWFAFLLVPDKTTAYQMLAAYGVQSVAENPKVQEMAGDGVDVLQALMKKAKKELEEKK